MSEVAAFRGDERWRQSSSSYWRHQTFKDGGTGEATSQRRAARTGLLLRGWRQAGLAVGPEQGLLASSRWQRNQGIPLAVTAGLEQEFLVIDEAPVATVVAAPGCGRPGVRDSWLQGECGFSMGAGIDELAPAAKRWHLQNGDSYVGGSDM
eukprot:g45963.t1